MEPHKKRPFSEDEDSSSVKKRVLSGPDGSPRVNGSPIEQEEPTEADNLELFRKEAIFRRMKHYSREHERSQSRITELEKRKYAYETGLAAMAACWKQLVKTIRLLLNTEGMPEDMFDFTINIQGENNFGSEFTKTLEDNLTATRALVTKLIEGGGGSQAYLRDGSAFSECQKMNTQCISLQTQVDVIHARLKDSEQQKEEYHRALISAEGRLDRLRSKTAMALPSRVVIKKEEFGEELTEEIQRKPSSPEGLKSPVLTNGGHDSIELDILREQVVSREARIIDLERETALIRNEKVFLESEMKLMPYDKIIENMHYKSLLEHAALLQATVTESRAQILRLNEELNGLRGSRKEWEDAVLSAAAQANQELKSMLTKRDTENSRLREQREQQAAELNERRIQDSFKFTAQRELEVLADSRSERIVVLESEVARCKAQLAAQAGNEELMSFFMNGNTEQLAFFDMVKERLTATQEKAAALEDSMYKYQSDHPDEAEDIKVEVDIRQKLAKTERELSKYKTTYGDPPSLSIDASMLVEQLRQKEEELQRLRLLNVQHNQAETSLYAELDKLSAAWESLDRQLKNKVFDLSASEAQLKKALSEKAKSDNKYFAAMRDKDAVSSENQKLQRDQEKQNRVIERLVDAEKNLNAQLGAVEKELAMLKNANMTYKEKAETLSVESTQWTTRLDAEKQRVFEVSAAFQEMERSNAAKRVELRKLEDGLYRAKKELEQKQKQKHMDTGVIQGNDEEKQHLMSLLKCSICRTEFRNTVITKCMHTFCRTCVDARISTRQRRCPACTLPFSQSDVLYGLYFQ